MAIFGVNQLCFTVGQNQPGSITTDGTYLYTPLYSAPGTAAGIVKTLMSGFTETANLTFSSSNYSSATDIALLGGAAYTTINMLSGISVANGNSGLVIETNTTSMTQTATKNLWSPSSSNLRASVSILSDASSFLYVASGSSYNGSSHLNTQVSKLNSSMTEQAGSPLSLTGTWSSVARTSQYDGTYLYLAMVANQSPSDASFPNDAIVQINVSSMTQTATINMPTTDKLVSSCLVGTKLYVGSTESPPKVYLIDTTTMTLQGVVITLGQQYDGVEWLMSYGNTLYVATSGNGFNSTSYILLFDLRTYQMYAAIPGNLNSYTAPFISAGIIAPNTQGTVQYWTTFGSPGCIFQTNNINTGPSSVYASSSRQTAYGNQMISQSSTQTRSSWQSAISSGYGVSTLISSTGAMLQAALMGDPHFTGFEGEDFFFNGQPDKFYNLFSDKDIQINSLFRHWETAGNEPMTAMEEIGITLFNGNRIRMTSRGSVEVNGKQLRGSTEIEGTTVEITKDLSGNHLDDFKIKEGYGRVMKACVVEFWPFTFVVVQATDDVNSPYLNFLARIDQVIKSRPHGIVGQTADFDGKPKERLDGAECDYEVSDLWSNDFVFNKFNNKCKIVRKQLVYC